MARGGGEGVVLVVGGEGISVQLMLLLLLLWYSEEVMCRSTSLGRDNREVTNIGTRSASTMERRRMETIGHRRIRKGHLSHTNIRR